MSRVVGGRAVAVLVLAAATAAGQDPGAPPKGLVFPLPEGFEPRPAQKLYYHPGLRVSISPSHQEGADFEAIAAELTAENLEPHKIAVTSRELAEVDGRRTLILRADRLNGKSPQKMIVVAFPTPRGVAQILTIYPADLDDDDRRTVDRALMDARYVE